MEVVSLWIFHCDDRESPYLIILGENTLLLAGVKGAYGKS